jgi:hypothetical protein
MGNAVPARMTPVPASKRGRQLSSIAFQRVDIRPNAPRITPGELQCPTFALMVCIGAMGGYYINL